MPHTELDLNPVQHITADAIGQPGQRVFYLQGWQAEDIQPVTLIIEKIQLQTLAAGLEQLLAEVLRQNPSLVDTGEAYEAEKMRINPPVDPLFRAGELGLGYDAEQDLVVILVREILLEDADPDAASVVRFWCSRKQARWLAGWGKEVVERGRPICPQCGQPMEPEGHFCPKKNGHKH
ncbi:MAG TPA: DUF3090 domain-containing protein [Anaerolineales bacterium]|nr:DUF3090 domain-containing protein [Anaerolineales bacterium]